MILTITSKSMEAIVMRNPRAFLRLLLLAIAIFASFSPVYAAGEFHDWRYREGDSPRTAFGGFTWLQPTKEDEKNWIPYDKEKEAPPISGTGSHVWLRARLDPTSPDVNTIFFVTMNQSFRVWQDDVLVYQYGTLAHQQIGYGWRWHLITLPSDKRNSAHTITFQMYSESPVSLGRLIGLSIDTNANQVQKLFLFDLPYFINLPIALMLMVIVGVYYLNQSELRRLYRASFLFLVIFAVWMFSASNGTVFLWDQPGLWWHVLLLMFYLMPVSGSYIVLELVDAHFRPIIQKTFHAYAAIAVAAVGLELAEAVGIDLPLPPAFVNQDGFMIMIPILFVAMIFLQAIQIFCLYRSEGDDRRHCRAFLSPCIILPLVAILNVVCRALRLSPLIPYLMALAPFTIFAFAYFIFSLVSEQFHKERSLIALARSLEIEVASAVERSELDPLTKAFNRRKFDQSVQETITLARIAHLPVSVLMLDIDFFKNVNDNYGHDMGDRVLINFADLIRQKLSPQETLFRWGGEEFVVLCRTHDLSQACILGERLRKAVEASSICPKQRITCSVGVATWHDDEPNETVFKRMDEALYAAKQSGRNRVVSEASPLLEAAPAPA